MPYRKPDSEIPGRILSRDELKKIDALCREGMPIHTVSKILGFHRLLYMKKALRMSGFRVGSVIDRHKPKYVTRVSDRLSVPELEVLQALLVDDGFSERKTAKLMYEATGREVYASHVRMRQALLRSGYCVRQGVIALDTGEPITSERVAPIGAGKGE